MSLLDNLKKFAQPYADDDYDDYDDDEEYLDDDYEEPAPRRAPARTASRRTPAPAPVEDDEEDDDYGFGMTTAAPAAAPTAAPTTSFSGRVVNMTTGAKQEVVLLRPANFGETTKAADALRSNKAVVLNLENVDKAMSRRVVDFLTGCVYALSGSVKKIAQSAYLFCPHNMDVVGDLESLQAEVESYI